jgi:nitroimidazol reductase NimA-like FMN-containing flavoprotein (pyridoxamine 5'-phosphate oxidase superfamily)
MIEIRDLDNEEIENLLGRLNYGHLALTDGLEPYVVPIHYAYDSPYIYIYTTDGKKSELIRNNPRVCLQIEEVLSNTNWQSVIVNGEAEHLTEETERSKALDAVVRVNPTLTPAVSIRWMDNWVRENIEVIYRIVPVVTTGRASVPRSETRTPYVPSGGPGRKTVV